MSKFKESYRSLLEDDYLSIKRRPYLHSFLNSAVETVDAGSKTPKWWPWVGGEIGDLTFDRSEFFSLIDPGEKKNHGILFANFNNVGCFAVKIVEEKNGFSANIFDVYLNHEKYEKHGFANDILVFLRNQVYPRFNVKREKLKADYIGRYVWAKLGFKFAENYWYKDGGQGKALKLWEVARLNLSRFMTQNNICLSDLGLNDLNELRDPVDFANLKLKGGGKIKVEPQDGDKFMLNQCNVDLGKAFMIGSYMPSNSYIVSMARSKLSAVYMPYWNGFRQVQ